MYDRMFSQFAQSNPDVLSPQEMQFAMSQTQMPGDILEHVWNITDEEDKGMFDRPMFATAIHILGKVRQG